MNDLRMRRATRWSGAAALGAAALFAAALAAEDGETLLKDAEAAAAKLASAGGDRTAVVAARNALQGIAHRAARPGAARERARVARALAEAYQKTDLVEPRNVLAEVLSLIGGEESVPALASALGNAGAREMARFALVRNPSPAAARALREALSKERDPDFRIALLNGLGSRRDQEAVKLLAAQTGKDEPLEVRLAAIEALSRLAPGSQEVSELLGSLPPAGDAARARERLRVFDSLVVLGESLIAAGKRESAEKVYQRLLEAASAKQERCAALVGLGKAAGGLEAILSALKDEDGEIRTAALGALAAMPGSKAFAAVSSALKEADPGLRARLLGVLAGRSEPEAGELAAGFLGDPDPAVRKAALGALEGRSGKKVAVALALSVVKGGEAAGEGAVGVLGRLPGEPATEAIMEVVKTAKDDVLPDLLRALARREEPSALRVLLQAAKSDSAAVRAAAYEGLGIMHSDRLLFVSLGVLIQGLERGGAEAEAAEKALGRHVSPEATRDIADAARAKKGPAGALLRVLGKRGGPEVVALLLEGARDTDESVKVAALEGLSTQKDPAVIPVLLEAAERGPEKVRPAAVLGCLRFGRAIEEKDRAAALSVYHKALALAARNEEKSEALQGIGRLADPSSLPVVKPFLTERNRGLQQAAAAAVLPIAAKLGEERKEEAVEVLKAALALVPSSPAARAAVEKLRRMGVDYDVAREAGFITHYWLLGPFPSGEKAFEQDILDPDGFRIDEAKEVKVGDKTLTWKHHHTADPQGIVNLEEAVGRLDSVGAYAYAEVTVPEEKRVSFKVGSDDSVVVWLNGKKIHGVQASRGLTVDQDNINGRLAAGKNRILLKVLNGGAQWAFCFRITDRQGAPLKVEQREKGEAKA